MRLSTERILSTHVGSLPRSQAVTDVLFARENGTLADAAAGTATIAAAVQDVVRRQMEAGIDVVSDGEMSKISYATYIADRFTGFAGDTPREPGQDLVEFPGLLKKLAERGATAKYRRPRCVGDIKIKDLAPLQGDIDHLRAAVAQAHPSDAFLNAGSPGVIAFFQPNDYYPNIDAYLEALAEALRTEYEAIVEAGLLLQIDAPDRDGPSHDVSPCERAADFLKRAALHIEVLNHALRNVARRSGPHARAGAPRRAPSP